MGTGLTVVAGVLALGVAGLGYFWWPPKPDLSRHGPYDAVVALGGGPHRLEKAVELVESGTAPLLLVSGGDRGRLPRSVCSGARQISGVEVVCFDPVPPTTQGEVHTVAEIVAHRGLDSIVVVTNGSHAHRTRLMFGKCVAADSTVYPVAGLPLVTLPYQLIHEAGGVAKFLLVDGCER